MTRNMCVAFVPLPHHHHHVQVQLFLFSDLPLIPLIDPPSPQPSLFIFQSHIFPSFLLLNSSTNQPHPLLAICGTVAVYPSILHIVDCCLACFVLYYFFLWFYRCHIHLCYMMYLSKLSLPSNYSFGENNYH